MIRSVFFIAGELSADRYAAALLAALRDRLPEICADAIGGPHLQAAGVSLFRDSSRWGAIGVAEVIKRIPPIYAGQKALQRRLRKDPPDLLLPLDFGAFNVPTADFAHNALGIPTCYAIPPGSWKPDGGRVSPRLSGCADLFLTPFRPSEQVLKASGLNAHFLGHPLLDFLPRQENLVAMREAMDLSPNAPTLALLPGSRGQELRYLTPTLLEGAKRLAGERSGLQGVVPLAPSLSVAAFEAVLRRHGWEPVLDANFPNTPSVRRFDGPMPLVVLKGRALDALAVSDAAFVCSGTATLEAALVNCPMIIGYRGGGATLMEYAMRKSIVPDSIGLPNIMLGRKICPELIQDACTPETLAELALPLLEEGPSRSDQKNGFQELRGQLGEPGVINRWADLIVRFFGGVSPRPHRKATT
jgi:lipid-A-disaccharide synthase